MSHHQPEVSEYRGFHITDYRPSHLHNPVVVNVPGFGAWGRPSIEAAHELIDGIIAKHEQKLQPGEIRFHAVNIGTERTLKASTCRNRTEVARSRRRTGGRFA